MAISSTFLNSIQNSNVTKGFITEIGKGKGDGAAKISGTTFYKIVKMQYSNKNALNRTERIKNQFLDEIKKDFPDFYAKKKSGIMDLVGVGEPGALDLSAAKRVLAAASRFAEEKDLQGAKEFANLYCGLGDKPPLTAGASDRAAAKTGLDKILSHILSVKNKLEGTSLDVEDAASDIAASLADKPMMETAANKIVELSDGGRIKATQDNIRGENGGIDPNKEGLVRFNGVAIDDEIAPLFEPKMKALASELEFYTLTPLTHENLKEIDKIISRYQGEIYIPKQDIAVEN